MQSPEAEGFTKPSASSALKRRLGNFLSKTFRTGTNTSNVASAVGSLSKARAIAPRLRFLRHAFGWHFARKLTFRFALWQSVVVLEAQSVVVCLPGSKASLLPVFFVVHLSFTTMSRMNSL